MLSLFKSKPKLAELIPSGYVDIHSHVLPGIDDGAQKIKDSKFLLESMIDFGFSKVITTPHTMKNVWDNSTSSIGDAYNLVHSELPELSKQVSLQFASEYFLDENLIRLAQQEKLLSLKDNFILIEMSYLNAPIQLYDFLFELQLKGYQLVLAHPERYNYFHSYKKEYQKLKKAGCLFQLNLLSTVGYYGKNVAEIADYLLKENLYDFVGSDIHHKNHVAAFQNKVMIKNYQILEETMPKNVFFK
ncbi:tyrosine-protein phosphatase [Flavobacterium cheniae]|uniref:protein-tyrosine-phosphatase n=1 Tax=Flavobacterium cheniae TaxID=295428 RepID=A0A562KP80_9FLAO|nr:CpsB/CapC family capsule biosynthesis tyrosine phosphatase [Flavobacterium cheniae]TDR22944.1 tyrosine-protein phosphatase YwqE [Flavobacterium cheniae]TWH97196.1 tyrosine-protein phosphatase YwqE [Flavobacterium cheniae]